MRKPLMAAGVLAAMAATPAAAQGIPVYDQSGFAQALATVKNTLSMIEQGKQQISEAQALFGSLNKVTDVNGIATSLSQDAVRRWLPPEARDIAVLMNEGPDGLGAIGNRATTIRNAGRVNLPTLAAGTPEASFDARGRLDTMGNDAARDAALAESAYDVTRKRTDGLEELRGALDGATDAKDVLDIQARIGVENAHIQNDAMQLQAVAMRQAAGERLRAQQESERILSQAYESLSKP
ncbi:type IV secretion system protein [Novosphingobium panipatense]|uniref:Type IV secretion system protein VirB5 n=1 Tax=Novosphingobium panipatense TaxID=428991 RepID=A0ABY1QW17_9SPHN|nr:type IV secretion system protein [Novosphingobium panipatense]SMP80772.1 type IV secretion system protein VirB5 [Novosphingobium panipatense]